MGVVVREQPALGMGRGGGGFTESNNHITLLPNRPQVGYYSILQDRFLTLSGPLSRICDTRMCI